MGQDLEEGKKPVSNPACSGERGTARDVQRKKRAGEERVIIKSKRQNDMKMFWGESDAARRWHIE